MPSRTRSFEARLEDGDLTPLEPLDLLGHDVGADHVVAQVGEARPCGQAHVAGTDDGDVAHVVVPPEVAE